MGRHFPNEGEALFRGKEWMFCRVDADRNDHLGEEVRRARDEVEVAQGDRIEAPRVDGEVRRGGEHPRRRADRAHLLPAFAGAAGVVGVAGFFGTSFAGVASFAGAVFGASFGGVGGVVGAVVGAVAGSQMSARGRRTENSVLGGLIGAVIGAGVGGDSANCNGQADRYDQRAYDQGGYGQYGYDQRAYGQRSAYSYDGDDRDRRYEDRRYDDRGYGDAYGYDRDGCRTVETRQRDRYGREVTRYEQVCRQGY